MVFAFLCLSVAAIGIFYMAIRSTSTKKTAIVDVTGALDGRTIEVICEKRKERVILAGIGFPPGDQKSETDCAEVVQEMIVGRRLFMDLCKDVAGCKYVMIKSSNGDCVNTMMLSKGLARYESTGVGFIGELVEAESVARAKGLGVWDKNRALFRHISREPLPVGHYSDSSIDEYAAERD